MRVKSIALNWFRGAAEQVELDCDLKSVVVYGQNAAGKSSFVDAVEYAVRGGRIQHLAHEYSGAKQERAVRNTHTPSGRKSGFCITLNDGAHCEVVVAANGTHTKSGTVDLAGWDYRRTALRQDEISRFIHSSKGEKYSDLLPLLGFGELEIAADNMRQTAKSVEQVGKLREKRGAAGEAARKRQQHFGGKSDAEIVATVEALHKNYCPASATSDPRAQCEDVIAALSSRITSLTSDNMRHLALKGLAGIELQAAVDEVREVNGKLAGAVEPLIAEKLEVLEAAHAYGTKLTVPEAIACPACGQAIEKDKFNAHVEAEKERLKEIDQVFRTRRTAIGTLIDAVKSIKASLSRSELKGWVADLEAGALKEPIAWVAACNPESLRQKATEAELGEIEKACASILAAAEAAAKDAPPNITALSNDKTTNEAAKSVFEAMPLAEEIAHVERLIAFIEATEERIRKEIRNKSAEAIASISGDIRDMWTVLHPDEPIDNVRLYLPDGDKAIDIALTFHGKDQDSPRLTLSEGYRNSLGLCIFLALAKRESATERPLILDDVVVSFDRNHRGMIVELLQKEFSDRQLIIFTHDRDWFADLRHQLDAKSWRFSSLLPFESPVLGIRWSSRTAGFDDARAHLQERPDSAGNDARKIMDVELAMLAENLQLRLPYLRGDKNDHRMCVEFLERLIADGKKCLQKKVGNEHPTFADGLAKLDLARRLLVTWGNKASHTTNVLRNEATKLIEACELALEVFKCEGCAKALTFSEAAGAEWVQCQCGDLRWRYGKG